MLPLLITAVRQILFSDKTKKLVDISGEKGLVYDATGGALTNGRSSTATVVDFEGLIRNCKAGEIRYSGARRVENKVLNSELFGSGSYWSDNGGWTITDNNAIAPNGTLTAATVINNIASRNLAVSLNTAIPGDKYVLSVWIKPITLRTNTIMSLLIGGSNTYTSVQNQLQVGVWKRISINCTAINNNTGKVYLLRDSDGDYEIWGAQLEFISGQVNVNPSDYVSSGITYNAGVPGVKYFPYQNGNTVSNNVVTEGVGAAISGIGILHEGVAANLIVQSQNHTTWTDIGTPTLAAGNKNYGTLLLDLIGDDSSIDTEGKSKIVAFTGNAQKSISVFVKQGTSTKSVIRLRDTTASADRLNVEITWSGSVPVLNFITGSQEKSQESFIDGVYRLYFLTTSVTAANTNQIEIYPSSDNILSILETGNINIGGWQLIDGLISTSYIPTTTAAVSRAIDSISLPYAFDVNFSHKKGIVLLKMKMKLANSSGNKSLFAINTGTTDMIYDNGSGGIALYDGITVATSPVGGWSANDILLIAVCWDNKQSKMSIHVSKNGGAWVDSSDSAYDGGFSAGSNIVFCSGNSDSIEIKSNKIYKTNKSFQSMQKWIKEKAVSGTI